MTGQHRVICDSCGYETDFSDEMLAEMPKGLNVWNCHHCGENSMRFK